MSSIVKSKIYKTFIGAIALVGTIVASVIVTIAVKSNDSAVTRLSVIQEKPTIFTYDNAPGEVPGTKTYFAAELTDSGESFGLLTGNISSIKPVEGNPEEARLRTLIFRLPEGQIIAMGNSLYPRGAVEIDPNSSITIAVIGGTGEYIGARGEVISTRNADGTYTHDFILSEH